MMIKLEVVCHPKREPKISFNLASLSNLSRRQVGVQSSACVQISVICSGRRALPPQDKNAVFLDPICRKIHIPAG